MEQPPLPSPPPSPSPPPVRPARRAVGPVAAWTLLLGSLVAVASFFVPDAGRPDGNLRELDPIRLTGPPAAEGEILARMTLPGRPLDVRLLGDALYASLAVRGMATVDVAEPESPRLVGTLEGMRDPEDAEGNVVVSTFADELGRRLYVFDRRFGLSLYDAADPFDPRLVWRRSFDDDPRLQPVAMTCVEATCYLACGGGGLVAVSSELGRSDPSRSILPFNDYTTNSAFFPPHWLLAADGYDMGMQVIDISDPERPTPVHAFQTGHYCDSIERFGEHAVLATRGLGFYVLDMTDPTRPFLANHFAERGRAEVKSIAVWRDDYLLTGNTAGMIDVFEMSDPPRPLWVGRIDCGVEVRSIAVRGDLIFAGLWDSAEIAVVRLGLRTDGRAS